MKSRESAVETGEPATAWDKWGLPLVTYYGSTLVVVIAAIVGYGYVELCTRHSQSPSRISLMDGLAAWGLILFMAYQWWAFDEPLAFVKTQSNWSQRLA